MCFKILVAGAFLACLLGSSEVLALNNGLALTPPSELVNIKK